MTGRCFHLSACLLAATAAAQPPPGWADADKSEPAGIRYRTFASASAGTEVSYLIYLPPDYDSAPKRRYPVIYWLHGIGGNARAGTSLVRGSDKEGEHKARQILH